MSNNYKEFIFEIKEINDYCSCIYADETNFNPNDFEEGTTKYKSLYDTLSKLFYSHINSMLIVCTQNSKSCTKENFQHLIKNITIKISSVRIMGSLVYRPDIRFIDKGDATITNNSKISSCFSKKIQGKPYPYNCRTRIYTVDIYSDEYKNSDNIIKRNEIHESSRNVLISPIDGIPYCALNISINKKNPDRTPGHVNRSKEKLFVKKSKKRIINISSEGLGAILFDIIIENVKGFHERFIICNSNLPKNSSDNILRELKKELDHSLPFNLIMVTPNDLNFDIISTENNKRKIFSNTTNRM